MKFNTKERIILTLLVMIIGINIIHYYNTNSKELVLAYNTDSETGMKEYAVTCDYADFEYNELEEKADIIALIKVTDNLTEENSYFTYDDIEGKYLVGYYGERKVKVLKYYKTDDKRANEMKIIEPAAIKNDIYFHNDDYLKMSKGKEYVVYLSTDNASGKYSIMAGSTGITEVKNVSEISDYEDVTSLYNDEHQNGE